jgi:hypothetical protein
MKTLTRANEKVERDYKDKGGWQDVKDLVRVTILAQKEAEVGTVLKKIQEMCKPPWSILGQPKMVNKDLDRCGYSGLNCVVEKRSGNSAPRPAGPSGKAQPRDMRWAFNVRMEIQANVPEIIYGKQHEKDFKSMLGDIGESKFQEMENRYHIVGGLGHDLYEITQKPPSVEAQKTAWDLSKRYYAYLRDPGSYSRVKFVTLCSDLISFIVRQDVKMFFSKHPVRSVSLIGLPSLPTKNPDNLPKKAAWPPKP